MAYETEAVVLRTVRYGEADSVLALYTLDRGRVSAIAKGARRTRSRMAGRIQPGTRLQVSVHEGRGELGTLRGATVLDPHAGLWIEGYRLQAASAVLEGAMRVLPDGDANPGAYHLLVRALGLLARVAPGSGPARLDPLVLSSHAKLLVVSGIVPLLAQCANCSAGEPLVGFSPEAGGALCRACSAGAERLEPGVRDALAGLLTRPLAEAADACPAVAGAGVERLIGLLLRAHLGVTLRSAAPL